LKTFPKSPPIQTSLFFLKHSPIHTQNHLICALQPPIPKPQKFDPIFAPTFLNSRDQESSNAKWHTKEKPIFLKI